MVHVKFQIPNSCSRHIKKKKDIIGVKGVAFRCWIRNRSENNRGVE